MDYAVTDAGIDALRPYAHDDSRDGLALGNVRDNDSTPPPNSTTLSARHPTGTPPFRCIVPEDAAGSAGNIHRLPNVLRINDALYLLPFASWAYLFFRISLTGASLATVLGFNLVLHHDNAVSECTHGFRVIDLDIDQLISRIGLARDCNCVLR